MFVFSFFRKSTTFTFSLLSSPSLFLSGVATCLRERGRSTARRGGATAGSGAAVNSTAKASTCSAPSNVAAMFIARYGTFDLYCSFDRITEYSTILML